MSDYLTLDEAAEFLSTPRSTLYRWLREGRIPGHKLGRRWRFLRSELEAVRSGGTRADAEAVALSALAQLLGPDPSPATAARLAERIVWDAVDAGTTAVHLSPDGATHRMVRRTADGLEPWTTLGADAFEALDRAWRAASRPVRDDDRRRFFLERALDGSPDRVQVRYRKLATLGGDRLTLRLVRERATAPTLDRIAPAGADRAFLQRLCRAPHGLVLLAGRGGSGKTTTAYSLLQTIAAGGDRVLFTLEEAIGDYLPGVNQVEVDLADERAVRGALSAVLESDPDVLFVSSTEAQPHRAALWGAALSAAEGGHLVLVQLEASSAADALAKFCAALDRPPEPHLVGIVHQQLVPSDGGGRTAAYERFEGPLMPPSNPS